MNNNNRNFRNFDFVLFLLVITIAIIGIILVGSATKVNLTGQSSSMNKQIILFICGLVLMFLATFIDYQIIAKCYIPIYAINILLLLFVLFFGKDDGTNVNRWIGIGGFGIQPSEFSKIFMILFMAKFIDLKQEAINEPKMLAFAMFLIVIPVLLIFKQPSLSAAIVVFIVSCAIMFLGGVKYSYFLVAGAVAIIVVSFIYVDAHLENHIVVDKILKEYQIERIVGTSKDQTNYSIQAIASGQLKGKGLYNGEVNQLNYLAESHTDFIFSVFAEEFGFIGSVGIIALIFTIVLKCMVIAQNSLTNVGRLISAGVGTMIGFQTFFHVGIGTGILPNTGVAFPFLSTGGSSLWINMIGIGLVLNVGMTRKN